MFFINHNFHYVILDLESIGDKQRCVQNLFHARASFHQLYIVDRRGEKEVLEDVGEILFEMLDQVEVYPEKPFKTGWGFFPLDEFLAYSEIVPYDALFISEDCDHLQEAQSHPVGTLAFSVKATSALTEVGPDLVIDDWSEIHRVLNGELAGYLGELNVCDPQLLVRRHASPKGIVLEMKNNKLPEVPIYFGGRYLIADDPASERHLFSLHLRKAKDYPEQHAQHFSHVISSLLSFITSDENLTAPIFTYVPPKKSAAKDRLGLLLADLPKQGHQITNVLRCTRDYLPQKEMSGSLARAKNVAGAFEVINPKHISGKDIVLIDDIGTTFSTVNECARTLLKSGASRVVVLCIAVTCQPSKIVLPTLSCEKCGHKMKIQFNSKDGSAFWACSNYRAYKAGEKHKIIKLLPGFSMLKTLDKAASENINF